MMPAYTFIASAHAVCNAGLSPFLVEVDPATLMLTPQIARSALAQAPERPAAILVVSAFGAPPDFDAWADFEKEIGIPVVFDAAAAISAIPGRVRAQPVCVSLHATKCLGIGEGGAIFSSDETFLKRTAAMTGFGFMGISRVSEIRGGNFRISEYAAAVGLAALAEYPNKSDTYRSLSDSYLTRLAGRAVQTQAGVGADVAHDDIQYHPPGS